MRFLLTLITVFFLTLQTTKLLAQAKIKITGKLQSSEESIQNNLSQFRINLLQRSGSVESKTLNSSGNFKFVSNKKQLKGSSLFISDPDGKYFGPIVLQKNLNELTANLYFSGKTSNKKSNKIPLGKVNILENHASVDKNISKKSLISKQTFQLDSDGTPLGAGNLGFVAVSQNLITTRATQSEQTNPGDDLDADGIPNAIDSDDDGDRVMDYADPDTSETTARDNLFTTLFLNLSDSLNANIGDGLSISAINSVMEGANKFAFTFYLSASFDQFTGGHFECSSSLAYCNPEGSDAVYSGVVESDNANKNQNWFDFDTDGHPYNIELIESNGSSFLTAGVQPRASLDEFVPGQLMTAVLNTDTSTETRQVAIGPFFISVPAIKSYNAGFGEITMDYANSNAPGTSSGSPIVLSNAKTLKLTFWRPQRSGIEGAGESEFIDMGNLHYGVIISSETAEFTCAGLYSELSGTITENPDALGTGGSPLSSQGATLWPLDDSFPDSEVDSNNLISMTVDIGQCLSRAGENTSGTVQVTLTAAGENLSGGASRAAQTFHLNLATE